MFPTINREEPDRAGIIQAFKYTFEQCWKSIQKKAGHEGVEIGSPKKAFMFAFQNGWIQKDSEKIWVQMIEDRNLTSHTYKEDIATEVLHRIIQDYLIGFEKLLTTMKTV